MREVKAILQAPTMSKEKQEVWSSRILVESDSANAIKWSSRGEGGRWEIQCDLNKIESLVKQLDNISLVHRNRESNGVVDALAKMGVSKTELFKAWC